MSEAKILTLSEVSDIKISNVDKKSTAGEREVILCNYMDVYSNDYITHKLDFMEATATEVEVEKFKVEEGDVLITKDSETPYEIGIPSVVVDKIKGLVCAYHLALIKPDQSRVDSIFLSKQLAQPETTRYFSRFATGSTRYGLSNKAIANTTVRLPSLGAQKKIARILQTIDRAIEKTESLIDKYQQIKVGLMHDLFTRGIGPDGQLRPPREQAPELYKETPIGWIPKEWDVKPLQKGLSASPKNGFSPKEVESWQGLYVLGLSCLTKFGFKPIQLKNAPKNAISSDTLLANGDFLISRSNTSDLVGLCGIYQDVGSPAIYPDLMVRLRLNVDLEPNFLEKYLQTPFARKRISAIAVGTSGSMVKINGRDIKDFLVLFPAIDEQKFITAKLKPLEDQISTLENQCAKLQKQKSGLMHDLLTGKVPLQVEPESETEAAHV